MAVTQQQAPPATSAKHPARHCQRYDKMQKLFIKKAEQNPV